MAREAIYKLMVTVASTKEVETVKCHMAMIAF